LLEIPKIYPKNTKRRKGKLLPFDVLALHDLITLSGHEIPKKIIMRDSNISGI